MQSERELKQQYLRENILQANYDANQFMDYCQEQHGGIDIDNWSLQQLKDIVIKYIHSKNAPSSEQTGNISPEINGRDFGGFSGHNHFGNQPHKIDPSISNQFSEWGNFIEATKIEEKPKSSLELNLFDLDFLESFEKPKSQISEPVKHEQAKSLSVPADIAKKLQEGNSNFIVGYNPVHLAHEHSQSQKKPETSFKMNEIGSISGNIGNKPPISSSISPPSINKNLSPEKQARKDDFSVSLETKKVVSKSKLSGKQQINITGHQIINPNIFVPKYVLYWVTTNPLNVEVKRRLKDFESLRDLLRKFFPTTQIPHLQKCSRLNETEPAIIQRQILFLQSFINSILMNKELRCKLVEQFLLCPDLDLLKKFFKEYDKLGKPRAIQGLFTTEGTVNLKLDSKTAGFLDDQMVLSEFMEQHFTKTKSLYDELLQGFESTSRKLREIEEMNSNFYAKIKGLNSKYTPDLQCLELEKALDRIQYLHKQWSQSFKTQAKVVKSQIRHIYRYEKENVKTLEELLKVEIDMKESFNKRGDKDQANREQYSSAKLNQFKLNVQVPSKNITVLKYQSAYFREQCSQESLRYLRELAEKLDKKFKLFCQLQLSIGHDMEGCWRQFESFYR